jgi:hypothetical protein
MVVAMEGGVGGAIFLTTAMALLLVGSLSPAGALAPYPPHPANPVSSWSNGEVLCQFGSSRPSVGVSALGRTDAGMTVDDLAFEEASPGGSEVAVANLTASSWTVSNRSTDDAYDLSYGTTAELMPADGSGPAIGSADLRVDFILPAYEGSPDGSMNVVNVSFTISNWTWQSPDDHLVLAFDASASSPATEHLAATSAPGWLMVTSSNATGAELESLGLASTANASATAGAPTTVDANGTVAFASPALAHVTIAFGTEAKGFGSLAFTARVGVQLPATVAGVPTADLLAAGAAGVAASLAIAGVTRRVRRRPSRLIYAEE